MNPLSIRPAVAALLCATTAWLAGCAAPGTVFEGRHPMQAGWHRATIAALVSDADLPPLLRPACAGGAPAASPRQWVIVDYRPAGRPRRAAVPSDADGPAWQTSGMPVYLQVQGCQRALAPRLAAG